MMSGGGRGGCLDGCPRGVGGQQTIDIHQVIPDEATEPRASEVKQLGS